MRAICADLRKILCARGAEFAHKRVEIIDSFCLGRTHQNYIAALGIFFAERNTGKNIFLREQLDHFTCRRVQLHNDFVKERSREQRGHTGNCGELFAQAVFGM